VPTRPRRAAAARGRADPAGTGGAVIDLSDDEASGESVASIRTQTRRNRPPRRRPRPLTQLTDEEPDYEPSREYLDAGHSACLATF